MLEDLAIEIGDVIIPVYESYRNRDATKLRARTVHESMDELCDEMTT